MGINDQIFGITPPASNAAGTQYFWANTTSVQAVANGTWVRMNHAATIYDTESDFNTSSYRFTFDAASAGLWLFHHTVSINSVGNLTASRLYVNGGGFKHSYGYGFGSNQTNTQDTVIRLMVADDYVEHYAYQTSGGSKNTIAGRDGVSFTGIRLA
jgi:hypothetical protein